MERFNEVDEFHGKSFVGKAFGHRFVSTKAHGMGFLGTGEKVFQGIGQGGWLLSGWYRRPPSVASIISGNAPA